MSRILFGISLLLLCSGVQSAERRDFSEVDLQQLTSETVVRAKTKELNMNVIQWQPIEYWRTVYEHTKGLDPSQKGYLMSTLEPYFLLNVWQADITPIGTLNHFSRDSVAAHLKVRYIGEDEETIVLMPLEYLPRDIKAVVELTETSLSMNVGPMGDFQHIFVYRNVSAGGVTRVDSYKKGKLTINLKGSDGEDIEAEIELPLNSLYEPRKCPNGKDAHISWKYCPWTSEALPE